MMYFSETEEGERPRDQEEIYEVAWGGIRALIHARINDGSFGANYPAMCEDGHGRTGCDESDFWSALRAEIPSLPKKPSLDLPEEPPQTLDILDMIEFCWRCVGKPIQIDYHSHFQHYHIRFEIEAGQEKFRNDINRILQRNSLIYELTKEGCINRLVYPVLHAAIESSEFRTGDTILDSMLEKAKRKFLDPDGTTRREALEALWDAWERLKTLSSGRNKKAQTTSLLDKIAGSSSSKFRDVLEREARELNCIGNSLQIRHSEIDQENISESKHIDYLFHRLFRLVHMILRERQ